MCGRYTLRTSANELAELLQLTLPFPDVRPRYNVLPASQVPAVRLGEAGPEPAMLRWMYRARWAPDPKNLKPGQKPLPEHPNARWDKLATSGLYKASFKSRRCLLPADGFYEPEEDDNRTQKEKKTGRWFYFKDEDDRPFCFAGVWDSWGEGDAYFESVALITTEPNALTSTVGHKRSPVIVPPEKYHLWLDPKAAPGQLDRLGEPYVPEGMIGYLSNGLAKNPKNEGPELIESMGPVIRV